MKRRLSLILVFAMMITCLAGCGGSSAAGSKNLRILLSVSSVDTFRGMLIAAAEETAIEFGATLEVFDAQESVDIQVEHIKQAVAENYDVIMCGPVDADTCQEMEALAGDIPIVFYNSAPDASRLKAGKYVYVGSNESDAGKFQGEYILETFSSANELNVAILKGPKKHSATAGRTAGLKNTLKSSGKTVNYVFEDNANWDQQTAQMMFEVFLKTNQKCDVVVCNNDSMALGIVDACAAAGRSDIKILGIDATGDGCAAIEAGTMAFTVYQSAVGQGDAAVRAAIALGNGGDITDMEYATDDGKYVWIPFEKVDSANVKNYK